MTKFIEQRSVRRPASKRTVILYHAECTDGFVAAWAAYKKFGLKAQYIPVEHQVPPPDDLVGREIYTVDFTYPREITEKLMAVNSRVTAIDHHVSVADVTRMTAGGVYDNDKSGAMLSWEFFNPGITPPFLVRIVQDYDLHRFALSETVTLVDWLDLFDFDFKAYDRLARMLDRPAGLKGALKQGELVKTFREKVVQRLVANAAYEVQFEHYRVLAVTTELFHAETADMLAKGRPFGIAWRVRGKGTYCSLRSEADGVNVAELAAKYGGGGHAHAAGFVVPTPADLPFTPVPKRTEYR